MHSPDGNQLCCPGQSLWSFINEHVSEAELLKIHAALGHSLVYRYTEVHSEAELWHNLWQDSRSNGNSSKTSFNQQKDSRLSDPPAVKELVRAEVKMLLETLKERASNGESDFEELLQRYNPETINYVLGHQEFDYCKSLNLKNEDHFSRRSSCCSVVSNAEGELEAVKDKLNVTEIHRVITRLRCVFLEECEALTKMTKNLKERIKLKNVCHGDTNKLKPSLAELKDLRASLQTDLELLPSSLRASSAPIWRPKKSFRLPAETISYSQLSPKSGIQLNSPPPWQPKPPCHDPPTRTSSVRTLGLHCFTSPSDKSVKPCSTSRMDNDLKVTESQDHSSFSAEPASIDRLCRSCSRFHMNSERNSASLKNHLSAQSCVQRLSTDFNWASHRERKISPLCSSRNITPSPPPLLRDLPDAGSSSMGSPADSSVSANGTIKADDRKNDCSNGKSSVLTALQKNKSEKTSGISLISGGFDGDVSKEKTCRFERNKTGFLRINVNDQRSVNSFHWTADSSNYPKISTQPQYAKKNTKKPQSAEKLKPRKAEETQGSFLNMFPQPVCPVQDVNILH